MEAEGKEDAYQRWKGENGGEKEHCQTFHFLTTAVLESEFLGPGVAEGQPYFLHG
jgi:hypothetical protein